MTTSQQPVSPRRTEGWSPAIADRTMRRTAQKEAAFLLPHLKPGTRLLDCGCGPGTITIGLAEAVAPGEVVGIDIGAQQIELAKANAALKGTTNVRFQVADVLKLPFEDNTFDAVYANTLLMYFPDKAPPLKEMHRVLRPGGLVGIRDSDWGSMIMDPGASALRKMIEVLVKLFVAEGREFVAGSRNRGFLHRAGFVRCEGFADLEVHGSPEDIRVFAEAEAKRPANFLQRGAVEFGLADRQTLERLPGEILEWAKSPEAFVAMTLCSAIGWKEG